MPIRNPNPFIDPTSHLKSQVNPFAQELKDETLPIVFGERLKGKAGQWFNAQDHRERKLCVEIGSYKGKTLVEMAADYPSNHFLGIDITFKRVVMAAKRAQRKSLTNVTSLLAHMNAQSIGQIFSPEEIDLLMIFFPDPWTKKKQNKNRIINPEFVQAARSVLHRDGFLWFKTDNLPYFEIAQKVLIENGFVSCTGIDGLNCEYETPFERTFKNQGLPTYESFWQVKS